MRIPETTLQRAPASRSFDAAPVKILRSGSAGQNATGSSVKDLTRLAGR